jgi:glycosyltransferase involved in cell wall biosynthesis
MKGVKYIGSVWDRSGYAEAARNYILALYQVGIPVKVEPVSFESNPPPLEDSKTTNILESLISSNIEYDIVIVHTTPDILVKYIEENPGKYIINMTVWETSKIHPHWVSACNRAHEIWLPCQFNVDAFRRSGVVVPITKVIHGIAKDHFNNFNYYDFQVPGLDKSNRFVFYSIFQWHYRKNPIGLIKAYFHAFKNSEPVALVIKTYLGNNSSKEEELALFNSQINNLKAEMRLDKYPEVYIINNSMSSNDMANLYRYGDCYVLIHRGEGFGLTSAFAGLAGKPVISTDGTGNTEYMTNENSYLVSYIWRKVTSMENFNQWYQSNQVWTEPSIRDTATKMYHVYLNKEEAKQKGELLKQHLQNNFDLSVVGEIMAKRLRELPI